MSEVLFDKQDVETSKPNKPFVEPQPHQPQPGQIILTDEKNEDKMKRTLKMMAMLLCIAAFTSLSSCSKDNEDNEDLILGKWKCTVDNYTDNNNGYQHHSYVGEIWEFKDGGVLVSDGNSVAYSVSGETITIYGGLMSGTIEELTSSKLVLDLQYNMGYRGNPPDRTHLEFSKI